jgi:lantibiotic modifying enzyme
MNKGKSIRFIENSIISDKFDESLLIKSVSTLLGKFVQNQVENSPPEKAKKIYSNKKEKIDYSIYSGSGGNVYSFWRYHILQKKIGSKDSIEKSLSLFKAYWNANFNLVQSGIIPTKAPSFFQGSVGIFTMGCILAKEINSKKDFESNLAYIIAQKDSAQCQQSEYELLYGSTGYLYSLLLIKVQCQNIFEFNIDEEIKEMFVYLFNCGTKEKEKNKGSCLLYPWSRVYGSAPKIYIGAVHGIFGVLYMMLKATKIVPDIAKTVINYDNIMKEIKSTIKYLILLQFSDGNFPSSMGNDSNKLVHFCHGAPGSVYTLSIAYQIFNDEGILQALLAAGELIWQKGILRKGNSICHGITCNSLALFELYKLTKDEKWKIRALSLAQATFDQQVQTICSQTEDYQRLVKGMPDTPFSLMEGQAGLIAFYSDLLSNDIVFPGFEISS